MTGRAYGRDAASLHCCRVKLPYTASLLAFLRSTLDDAATGPVYNAPAPSLSSVRPCTLSKALIHCSTSPGAAISYPAAPSHLPAVSEARRCVRRSEARKRVDGGRSPRESTSYGGIFSTPQKSSFLAERFRGRALERRMSFRPWWASEVTRYGGCPIILPVIWANQPTSGRCLPLDRACWYQARRLLLPLLFIPCLYVGFAFSNPS